jgi:hypothetical protein
VIDRATARQKARETVGARARRAASFDPRGLFPSTGKLAISRFACAARKLLASLGSFADVIRKL